MALSNSYINAMNFMKSLPKRSVSQVPSQFDDTWGRWASNQRTSSNNYIPTTKTTVSSPTGTYTTNQSAKQVLQSLSANGGSTGNTGAPNTQALIDEMKAKMDEANAANQQLRSDIEGTINRGRQESIDAVRGVFDPERSDVAKRTNQQTAANQSRLARVGMYNTTNQSALERANQEDQERAMTDIAAREAALKAGIIERFSNRMSDFQNSINMTGPNTSALMALLERYGQGQGGQQGIQQWQSAIGGGAGGGSGGTGVRYADPERMRSYHHQFTGKSGFSSLDDGAKGKSLNSSRKRSTSSNTSAPKKKNTYKTLSQILAERKEEQAAALRQKFHDSLLAPSMPMY